MHEVLERLGELRSEVAAWEVAMCDAGHLTGDVGPFWAAFLDIADGRLHAVTRFEGGLYRAACGAASQRVTLDIDANASGCHYCFEINPAPTLWTPAGAVEPLVESQRKLLPLLACGFETAADINAWAADIASFFWHMVEIWEIMPRVLEYGAQEGRELREGGA